jgi:negative regulator of sigma E activity
MDMTIEPQILEELSALLDGELDQPRQEQLLAAMETNPQLAQQFTRLQAVRDAVRSLPAQAAPPGMAMNILSRLKAQAAPAPSARRNLLGQLAAAAVLIAAIGLGWALYFRQTPQAPEAKKDNHPVQLAKAEHEPEKPVGSPAAGLPAGDVHRDTEGGFADGVRSLRTDGHLDDYVPSSAGSVINEVTIDTDQPAEVAQRVNTIFNQLPDNGNVSQSRLAGNKLRIQSDVAITDEQKDKLLADLKDLASQQRVPQRQSGDGFDLATRGPSPAGASGSGAASQPAARPPPAGTRELNEPMPLVIAAAPATSPASAPAFARTTKDLSSRPAQAQAQNNALNNMARQQFVVIVNSVNAAEMRMEAASQTRENR